MQTEQNAKQQIVEKIKNATNILVTVGKNPSVDELSAALGLTLMLNRLDKHATAVFSGELPPAINFLEPNKTFESSVDSLRDFIVALDKEKADRLRYKVEDDVVRIFITPYKTVITEKDLKFSQGDFNVELIIALGVEQREDLDKAITAHGRILHDATVVTVNITDGKTSLGSLDWMDTAASSLSEMLMSLSEALQSGLLDQQIATSLLTGIVAATDRFRNERTTPKVMTMAAQLMAAGANQQLIAAKLEEGHALPSMDGTTRLAEGKSQKVTQEPVAETADGSLQIEHAPAPSAEPLPDKSAEALKAAEEELAKSLAETTPPTPDLSASDIQSDLAEAAQELQAEAQQAAVSSDDSPKIIKKERSWRGDVTNEPMFGGTLNATTEEAEEKKRREAEEQANRQILSHEGAVDAPEQAALDVAPAPPLEPPVQQVAEPVQEESAAPALPPLPTFETPQAPVESTDDAALSFEPAPIQAPDAAPTLADLDNQTRGQAAEDARAAVDAALSAMPFNSAGQPTQAIGATPVLELSHAESAPQAPGFETPMDPSMTPPMPPLPDFSTLPPLPDQPPVDTGIQPPVAAAPAVPQPTDPGQFKIPGQP